MLNGAIVGIGKIAQTGHLPAYLSKQIRDRAEVNAAVDPNEQSSIDFGSTGSNTWGWRYARVPEPRTYRDGVQS